MILKDWEVFGIPRVRLVEWVVERSATKPHEKQAVLYGRVCQFGNANMSCFLELSNIKQVKRALDLAELSVAPNGIKKGRSPLLYLCPDALRAAEGASAQISSEIWPLFHCTIAST